jgi:hypothetical protein
VSIGMLLTGLALRASILPAGRGLRHRAAPVRLRPFIMPNGHGARLGGHLRAAARLGALPGLALFCRCLRLGRPSLLRLVGRFSATELVHDAGPGGVR